LNSWRTQKAIKSLIEASNILDNILERISEDGFTADFIYSLWEAYSKLEYSVLMLKLHLGEDVSKKIGGEIKSTGDDSENLSRASDKINQALNRAEEEDYQGTLEFTRKSRNLMRNIMVQIRKKSK
jgi:hypothetical protein